METCLFPLGVFLAVMGLCVAVSIGITVRSARLMRVSVERERQWGKLYDSACERAATYQRIAAHWEAASQQWEANLKLTQERLDLYLNTARKQAERN